MSGLIYAKVKVTEVVTVLKPDRLKRELLNVMVNKLLSQRQTCVGKPHPVHFQSDTVI